MRCGLQPSKSSQRSVTDAVLRHTESEEAFQRGGGREASREILVKEDALRKMDEERFFRAVI